MAELQETPFTDGEEAFFYMVTCQKYKSEGARVSGGHGLYQRPAHPDDIRIVIERLYRNRELTIDHINILKHYGVRMLRPDDGRDKEKRAAMLWDEAMQIIGDALKKKGVVQ